MVVSADRDPQAERSLSPRARELIQQLDDLRRQVASIQGFGGRVHWSVLYGSLSSDDPGDRLEAFRFLEEKIVELSALLPEIQERAALQKEDDAWEDQGEEIDLSASPEDLDRELMGHDVWLWHGTSSLLWPQIKKQGLVVDPPATPHGEATPGFVYLSADPHHAGHFYARRAAAVFGGEPMLLRVLVPWDELTYDEDDVDIPSGRVQFRIDRDVLPTEILEVDGERHPPIP